jgi:hypothetical protein
MKVDRAFHIPGCNPFPNHVRWICSDYDFDCRGASDTEFLSLTSQERLARASALSN